MPRARGRRGGGHGGVQIEGLYEVLLRLKCERATAPDPRWYLGVVDAETRATQDRRVNEGKFAAEVLFNEQLAAAQPIVVSGRDVRDHVADQGGVAMLRDVSIDAFTVYPNDIISTN